MKEGWTYKRFTDCIDKVSKQKQVKSKDYKSSGKYPIVSQEKELISGYWDDNSYLFKHEKPIIIFGDHTKEIKYIDFDFVVGADGTQILSPKEGIDSKFFYYTLVATPLRTLGYARHFKLLKEKSIPIPPLSEQKEIVSHLDTAFAQIDALKANAEKQLSEARNLFQKALEEAMKPQKGWEENKIGDCFLSINNGANIKQIKGAGGIPITRIETLSNDKFNRDRLGFADIESSNKYKNYILNDGDILMSHINSMKFLGRSVIYKKTGEEIIIHGMNLLRLIPKDFLCSEFANYFFYDKSFRKQILTISHQSVNQASFNVTNLKGLKIYIPSIAEQQQIVSRLDSLSEIVRELEEMQRKTIAECDALKQAILREVFE